MNIIDDRVGYLLADQMLLAEKNGLTGVNFVIFVNEKGELGCRRGS